MLKIQLLRLARITHCFHWLFAVKYFSLLIISTIQEKRKGEEIRLWVFKGKMLELLKWAWVLPISKWHVSVNVSESYVLQEQCKCTLWWSFRVLEQWSTFSPVFYKQVEKKDAFISRFIVPHLVIIAPYRSNIKC